MANKGRGRALRNPPHPVALGEPAAVSAGEPWQPPAREPWRWCRLRQPTVWLILVLLLGFPAVQTARFAYFAATVGGIEHDSGWYFGVARNLAERGIYATSTNMAKTPEAISDNIHGRPTVQDAEGYSYFCSGVTVGPGFIVPEALVLKLFGIGWWQYRLLPLAAMFALLVLLSALAYAGGGPWAAILLQVWLWALPTVTLEFAYEAYAEHVALFYSLLAIGVYAYALQRPSRRWPCFLTGLLLALAYLTKSLYLLTAVAVGLHWLGTVVQRRPELRQLRRVVIFTALGFLLPVVLFESYRFVSLVHQFGMAGYWANSRAVALHFRAAGSGLDSLGVARGNLTTRKVMLLQTLGLGMAIAAWPLVLLAAGLSLQRRENDASETRSDWTQTVLSVAGLKILLVFAWFIGLSSSIFTRHVWDGLVLLQVLTAVGIAQAGQLLLRRRQVALPIVLFVLVAANLACFDTTLVDLSPRISFGQAIRWLTPFRRPLQPLMFAPVFRRDLQEEAAAFLQQNVGPDDRIYYIQFHKIAELPPLVGKIFFAIDRYEADARVRRGRAFIILGPYQIGDWPWRVEQEGRINFLLKANRQQIVFQNDLYVVLQEPFQALDQMLPP